MPSIRALNEVKFRFHGYKRNCFPFPNKPLDLIVNFKQAPSSWLLNDISIILKDFLQTLPAEADLSERFKEVKPILLIREQELLLSAGEDTVILEEEEDEEKEEAEKPSAIQKSTDLFINPKHSGSPIRPKAGFIVHIYSASDVQVVKEITYGIKE